MMLLLNFSSNCVCFLSVC